MPGALTTEKLSFKRKEKQLLPGMQQRVLYNTIKYCSPIPLCTLVFLYSFSLILFFLSLWLSCISLHSFSSLWCALLSDGLWLRIDNDCARGFVCHGYQRIRVITGATVVTTGEAFHSVWRRWQLSCTRLENLEHGLFFSTWWWKSRKKAERQDAKTQRNKSFLGESDSDLLYLFLTFAWSFSVLY